MAKAKKETAVGAASDREWEVRNALDTLTRAIEIIKDKGLMTRVKKLAGEKASEMSAIASKADGLMKMGLISDKARAKIGKRG